MRLSAGRPPLPPPPTAPWTTDEGPARGELRRQIARLERILSALAIGEGRTPTPVSRLRGPALLTTAELEAVRDELLGALEAFGRVAGRR